MEPQIVENPISQEKLLTEKMVMDNIILKGNTNGGMDTPINQQSLS